MSRTGPPEHAVDLRMLNASGIGRYLQGLVPRVIEGTGGARWRLLGDPGEILEHDWARDSGVSVVAARSPIYSPKEQIEIPRLLRGVSLLWAPHYNVPLAYGGPLLVTVHDVLHLARPEHVEGVHRRLYARLMVAGMVRKADAILCDSEFTAGELRRLTRVDPGKLNVVHLGMDDSWFEPVAGASPEPRPYLLCIGNVKPHKNLSRLVGAFARLSGEVEQDLVIVGKRDGFITGDPRVGDAAAQLGDRVRFTGPVSDILLRRYLAHASALVFPSLYEGFGYPPLEAMACGCPVVASWAASIPEVCGEAAVYVEPEDEASIAAGIRRVLSDAALRDELVKKGAERARGYSWDACAAETLAVLRSVLDGAYPSGGAAG